MNASPRRARWRSSSALSPSRAVRMECSPTTLQNWSSTKYVYSRSASRTPLLMSPARMLACRRGSIVIRRHESEA
eukprot:1181360-Prorocentrum_minimum.AAC.3